MADYAARSVVAQTVDADIGVIAVDSSSDDASFEAFAQSLFLRHDIGISRTLTSPREQMTTMLDVALSIDCDAVLLHSGNAYWTSPNKIQQQLTQIRDSNCDYSWHPIVVRNRDNISTYPTASVVNLGACGCSIAPTLVPWQSLMIRGAALHRLQVEYDRFDFRRLRIALNARACGHALQTPYTILQNAFARGSLPGKVPWLSYGWSEEVVGARTDPLTKSPVDRLVAYDWESALADGTLTSEDIQAWAEQRGEFIDPAT
jgi:hypothetical protein